MTANQAARLLHDLLRAKRIILDGLELECSEELRRGATLAVSFVARMIELLRSELPEAVHDGIDEGCMLTDEALAQIGAKREQPFFTPEVEALLGERGLATGSKR